MKRETYVLVLTLLFVTLIGCNGKIYIENPPVYYEVQQELKNGNYEKVIELLDTTKIKWIQRNDWYYYAYGISLYNISPTVNVRKALTQIEIASKFRPTDYEYLYYLGQLNYEISEKEKAIEYFKKASLSENDAEEIPNNFNAYLWAIYLLEQTGKFKEALQFLNESSMHKESIGYKFYSSLLSGEEPFDIAKQICEDENISIYGKSLYLNSLFHNENKYVEPQKYIKFCETERDKAIDMKDYFNIQLIYFYLNYDGVDKCKKHLQSFSKEMAPNIFILDSFFALRQLDFDKYNSFYYWVLKDNVRTHNVVGTYQRKKYRPLRHSIVYSEDIGEFYKEFENDPDFIHLNVPIRNK